MTKPPNATGRWPAAIIAVSLAAALALAGPSSLATGFSAPPARGASVPATAASPRAMASTTCATLGAEAAMAAANSCCARAGHRRHSKLK